MTEAGMRQEVGRIRRVADMLCTGHASLRDSYHRRALALDLLVMGLSTWLVALAFVEPQINVSLTPFGINDRIWVGVLGTAAFFLTIIQLKTNWKERSDAHRRTFEIYGEVKREAGYLLAAQDGWDDAGCRRVLARYDMASAVGVAIPEKHFLREKKRHKLKVALSKHLDTHPGAFLTLVRLQFWWRDNFKRSNSNA